MILRRQSVSDTRRQELKDNAQSALLRGSATVTGDKAQFFELYKLLVSTSEALVSRRQGVNTFFLTVNGLLITAVGLFVRGGDRIRLQAAGIVVLAICGIILCVVWRSLLVSFGQLNTGKFVVIQEMEKHLPASIYSAEWEALAKGDEPAVYRSFTKREATVPLAMLAVYGVALTVGSVIWLGWWKV